MARPPGWSDFVTALGLLLIIEGLVLALMPGLLKRLVAEILTHPVGKLRVGGLVSAALGVVVIWLVRR